MQADSTRLPSAPAALRNRAPIFNVLKDWLPEQGKVLEIASGTGEHAAFFAAKAGWSWQCSDADPDALPTISGWTIEADSIIQPPLHVNVLDNQWWQSAGTPGEFSALYCANMIHIAPSEATEGLIAGAQHLLGPGGICVLYGPYRIGAHHTAPSNAAFDESLKARDSRWGLRDLGHVVETMRQHQLVHQKTISMPANNLCVIFKRAHQAPTGLGERSIATQN